MEQLSQFIKNHPLLWLALMVILILIFVSELLAQKKKSHALSPQAAVDKINNDNAVVIDIRNKELFNKAHIPNAIQVNMDDLSPAKLNKYKNKPLILVCARGIQSLTAANKLRAQGFDAMVLQGGTEAWQSADLPLVKGKG